MTTQSKNFSVKHLLALLEQPEHANIPYELICGGLSQKKNTAYDEIINRRIAYFLNAYVISRRCGRVAVREYFLIDKHEVYLPDIAFTTSAKPTENTTMMNTLAPSLVFEIATHTPAKCMEHKIKLYLRTGAQLVWIAYPESQTIEVYSLSEEGRAVVHVRDNDQHLTGGTLLPDFKMPVSVVFNG